LRQEIALCKEHAAHDHNKLSQRLTEMTEDRNDLQARLSSKQAGVDWETVASVLPSLNAHELGLIRDRKLVSVIKDYSKRVEVSLHLAKRYVDWHRDGQA